MSVHLSFFSFACLLFARSACRSTSPKQADMKFTFVQECGPNVCMQSDFHDLSSWVSCVAKTGDFFLRVRQRMGEAGTLQNSCRFGCAVRFSLKDHSVISAERERISDTCHHNAHVGEHSWNEYSHSSAGSRGEETLKSQSHY